MTGTPAEHPSRQDEKEITVDISKGGKCKDGDVIVQGGVVAGSTAANAGKILLEYLLFLMAPVSEYISILF